VSRDSQPINWCCRGWELWNKIWGVAKAPASKLRAVPAASELKGDPPRFGRVSASYRVDDDRLPRKEKGQKKNR
jgi:hypothetical protein